MQAVKVSLMTTISAAAFVLALGLSGTPAAAHCAGKHTGSHPHCSGGGGGDDGGGGKDQKAMEFDDINFSGITSDGAGLYVNAEPGVDLEANKGIRLDINSDGSQGDRHLVLDAVCFGAAAACDGVDAISGDFPLPNTGEWIIFNVFQTKGMAKDGKFYPKNARLLLAGFADQQGMSFQFQDPGEFNPGDVCSSPADGGEGAGGPVWVQHFDNGTWLVTTDDPAPGDIADGFSADDAGDVACLGLLDGGPGFGRNYTLPFSFVVGPESTFTP